MAENEQFTEETLDLDNDFQEEELGAIVDELANEDTDIEINGEKVNVDYMAEYNDTDADLIAQYAGLSASERELTTRFKSQLEGDTLGTGMDGKSRWDTSYDGESTVVLNAGMATECRITKSDDGNGNETYHCESDYLGSFDYDPDDWAIGYKEIPGTESENADGSLTKVPVFKYVGDVKADSLHSGNMSFEGAFLKVIRLGLLSQFIPDKARTEQVTIPDGVKNLDYTFEGNDQIQLIPGVPDSVRSMHCTFKDCTAIHCASHEFNEGEGRYSNSGGQWDLPEELEDLSGAFQGCTALDVVSIGTLPSALRDISGMFAGCSALLDQSHAVETLGMGAEAIAGIFGANFVVGSVKEADWSSCPYLREEFANPLDTSTSDKFKANAEREAQEMKEFHEALDVESEPEEVQEQHADANAANTVKRTERVLDGTDDVRDIEELSLNLPEKNYFGELVQKGVIDIGSFAAIRTLTKHLTGSGFIGTLAGFAGTWALSSSGVLPKSIEPALNWVKGFLPEKGQAVIDTILEKIGQPNIEELIEQRKERYNSVALSDSFDRPVSSFGVVDSTELYSRMRTNAKVVAEAGVFERVAQDPADEVGTVSKMMTQAVSTGASSIESLHADGTLTEDQMKQQMRDYYMGLMNGLEAYNKGAKEGFSLDSDLDSAYQGLALVNKAYADPVMASLEEMDAKYHFMTETDKQKLSQLDIEGVSVTGYEVTSEPVVIPDAGAETVKTSSDTKYPGRPLPDGYDEASEENEQDGYEF